MKKDRPWTKSELSLKLGPIQLAYAVIEQWKRDGSPACDTEAIEYWKGVIKNYADKTK